MSHQLTPPRVKRLLEQQKRYKVKEVALILNISPKYLYRCVVAARDEIVRQKYGISIDTLRRLPVFHWFQQGAAWVIRERDLLEQLEGQR